MQKARKKFREILILLLQYNNLSAIWNFRHFIEIWIKISQKSFSSFYFKRSL